MVRRKVLVLAMCAAVAGCTSCGGPAALTQECDWSEAERAAVESVPLGDFVGVPVSAGKATCDTSYPQVLSVTASVPGGQVLPDGWQDRVTVASWTGEARVAETPNGQMVCYSSSSAEWREVQVRLWANGTVSAEILKDHDPCDPAAL